MTGTELKPFFRFKMVRLDESSANSDELIGKAVGTFFNNVIQEMRELGSIYAISPPQVSIIGKATTQPGVIWYLAISGIVEQHNEQRAPEGIPTESGFAAAAELATALGGSIHYKQLPSSTAADKLVRQLSTGNPGDQLPRSLQHYFNEYGSPARISTAGDVFDTLRKSARRLGFRDADANSDVVLPEAGNAADGKEGKQAIGGILPSASEAGHRLPDIDQL